MRKLRERFIKPSEDAKYWDQEWDMIELVRSYKLRVITNRKDGVLKISKNSKDLRVEGSLQFAGLKYCLLMSFYLRGHYILEAKYIGDSFEEFVEDLSDVVMFYSSTNYMKLERGYEKLIKCIEVDDDCYEDLPADEIYTHIIELKQNNDDLADVSDIIFKAYANFLARYHGHRPSLDLQRTENTNKL